MGPQIINADIQGDCGTAPRQVPLFDYPRMHLLRSGFVVHSNGRVWNTAINGYEERAVFMNVENPQCPLNPPIERWEAHADTSIPQRHGGSSVHIISRDAFDVASEVIYAIGGQDGENDVACCNASTDSVQRLVDPAPTSANWIDAPSLNFGRSNHDTVILADGSLLVVGGNEVVPPPSGPCPSVQNGTCTPVYVAELFRPTELFGSGAATWTPVAAQSVPRRYHAVLGLLPDGRVFSAGGFQPLQGNPGAWHSLEIYHPWYWFSTTRPIIQAWPDSSPPSSIRVHYREDNGAMLFVDVALPSYSGSVKRAALIRPGSVTHAFDFSQRYVQLAIDNQQLIGPPSNPEAMVRLELLPPEDGYEAPPGYYMLFVVDSACDVPSAGKWVLVEDL